MLKKVLFVFVFVFASSAYAGYEEGKAAYEKEDYATAFKEFKPLAEQGDEVAQFSIGVMYQIGQGVPEDKIEAVKWYTKAAEAGDAPAQSNLAIMYLRSENGEGYRKALYWFTKAAEQEYGDAQFLLGFLHETGRGTQKNVKEAVKWYTKAKKNGNNPSVDYLKILNAKIACSKKATTFLFDEALLCTTQDDLRNAAKNAGAVVTREDDQYWQDQYDSSKLLMGTTTLNIAYINAKFAMASYIYDSEMNVEKVVEVRNMIASKYGKPMTSNGNPSLGPVTYKWKLKDGIRVEVGRGWPDTTVHLQFIHHENNTAMEAEITRMKLAEEKEKRGKQSNAF